MNKEKLMSAIGNISDKHISACSDKTKFCKRRKQRACLFVAACTVLVIISIGYTVSIFSQPKNVIWNEQADIHEIEKCYKYASVGNVIFTESLENAIDVLTPSDQNKQPEIDEKCVFAVLITETTGVPKEEIYRQFVLPLGAEEDYMKSGIVFLTREQLKKIKCSDEMAIILSLAAKK